MVLCFYVSSTISVYFWGVLTLDDVTRGPRPLIDHVTTLSAYLNDYRGLRYGSVEKQKEYSGKFTCYLLSTCWKKIAGRIDSWQATSFIRLLHLITPEMLRRRLETIQKGAQMWGGFPSSDKPGDKTLKNFLRLSAKEKSWLQNLVLDHIPSKHGCSFEISNLTKSDSEPIFSRETIQDFHLLVIAAFSGFARAFIKVKNAYSVLVGTHGLSSIVDVTDESSNPSPLTKKSF